jgi:hypothetical protein
MPILVRLLGAWDEPKRLEGARAAFRRSWSCERL